MGDRKEKTEAEIQRDICRLFDRKGIAYTLTNAQGNRFLRRRMKVGWPDVTAILPPFGQALLVEVKRAKGRVEPHQEKLHQLLRHSGARLVVARSVEDVVAEL